MECEEWDGNADARNQSGNAGNLCGKVKKCGELGWKCRELRWKLRSSGRNYIQQWKWQIQRVEGNQNNISMQICKNLNSHIWSGAFLVNFGHVSHNVFMF